MYKVAANPMFRFLFQQNDTINLSILHNKDLTRISVSIQKHKGFLPKLGPG